MFWLVGWWACSVSVFIYDLCQAGAGSIPATTTGFLGRHYNLPVITRIFDIDGVVAFATKHDAPTETTN